ncbi:MAG: AMP-binding protein [Tatlockia sp.]|jgi:acyl-coenzyme A synthetase/AMP-(fatty) acid ligase
MMYGILSETAQSNPNAIALVTSDTTSYSYHALLNRVHQWAHYLLSIGVRPSHRVGFKSANDDNHLFFYLALDCIGACYVPLDRDLPKLQFDAGLAVLKLDVFLDEKEVDAGQLDYLPQGKPEAAQSNTAQDCTYIMSSSGTTGDRKWIPIQGAGLAYWAGVEKELLQLTPEDKILSTRSPAFDARISEYLRAFAHGATLYLMAQHDRKDMQKIISLCQSNHITTLLMVPSQLESAQFNHYLPALAEAGLKHLIVTGEACNWTLAILCKQLGIHLWNAYGPTEATFGLSLLDVTTRVIEGMDESLPVPIGKPIAPMHFRIIDGTLFVDSPYLSPGYLKAEDKQGGFVLVGKQRLFDTGDLFSETASDLIYHGRATFETHCKVGGVKVSPSHIERVIQHYPGKGLQTAVVVKIWLGHLKPVAYIKLTSEVDKEAFLAYLKSALRPEEIPVCLLIDALPLLSPSDKIDRQKLITLTDDANQLFFKLAPDTLNSKENNLEQVLAIWKRLFKLNQLSPAQDFFALGGDSLTANQLVVLVQKELDASYKYSDFLGLKTFTPKAMAKQLTERKGAIKGEAIATLLVKCSNATRTVMMLPPLLGEGCFTYKHLAVRYAKAFKACVYGVSSSALFDESPLPETLAEEAEQCYQAIKRVQPQGPYHLFGFSYGATLAWQVAELCVQKGDEVASLELMDGFPPTVLQKMPAKAHVRLLYSLIQFVVTVLTKKPYNEAACIPVSSDQALFEQLLPLLCGNAAGALTEKERHVDYVFAALQGMLKGASAKRIVALARQHLLFMLRQSEPNTLLPIRPVIFQTNETQDYWKMMDTIEGLIARAPDRRYLFWNRYCSSVRRNGTQLESGHLELLLNGSPRIGSTAESFWQRNHDLIFNKLMCDFGPESFHTCEKIDDHYLYNLHFLQRDSEASMHSALRQMNGRAKRLRYESSSNLSIQEDGIHQAFTSYQLTVSASEKKQIDEWLASIKCIEKASNPLQKKFIRLDASVGALYLTFMFNFKPTLDYSFECASNEDWPQKQLIVPEGFLRVPVPRNPKIYHFAFVYTKMGCSTFEAVGNCAEYLGQFIALLNAQINQESPVCEHRAVM